jgi:hypothetical protein
MFAPLGVNVGEVGHGSSSLYLIFRRWSKAYMTLMSYWFCR